MRVIYLLTYPPQMSHRRECAPRTMAPAEHRMLAAARRLSAHLRPAGDHRGARPPFLGRRLDSIRAVRFLVLPPCLGARPLAIPPLGRGSRPGRRLRAPRRASSGACAGCAMAPSAGFPHFRFKGPGGLPLRRFSAGTPGRAKFVSRAGRGPGPSGPDEKAPSTGSVTGCWIERRPMIIIRQRATAKRAMARRLIMALPGITTVTIAFGVGATGTRTSTTSLLNKCAPSLDARIKAVYYWRGLSSFEHQRQAHSHQLSTPSI